MATSTITPYPSQLLKSAAPPAMNQAPTYTMATVTDDPFGRHICSRRGRLQGFLVNMRIGGTTSNTTVQFRKNGSNITGATATLVQSDTDPLTAFCIPDAETDVEVGDVLDCDVTAASTAGSDLSYCPIIAEIYSV